MQETTQERVMVATIFVVAVIAVAAVALIAAICGCRWGGAKIEADVPIYGNALITVEPVEIETPEFEELEGE